jgi:predicted PurR-regulated permease PerM
MRAYLTDRNLRRLFVLVLFVGLLAFFRHLLLLLVFFVVFERTIGLFAGYLSAATKLKFKWSVLLVVVLMAGVVGGAVWFGVATLIHQLPRIRESAETVIDTIRHSATYERYEHLGDHVTIQQAFTQARQHAGGALHFAASLTREVLYVFIGLIFAVVFLMERDELEAWRERIPMDSAPRILLRYMGHVADAIAITLKLQVIVAVVNAFVTLPVLLALRLPGIPALVAMLIVTGLIPVVGGPIAGAVLMVLAYVTRGVGGLAVFVGSTFILHKIESYYLNPRLTAKHVKLPSFVIITSLILFEHTFGIVGLFLSFPCLYVAAKIREGWLDPEDEIRDEEETTRAMRGMLPKLSGFRLRPGVLRGLREPVDEGTGNAE